MLAVAFREYASFFRTPLGWLVVALFAFLSGISFVTATLVPGEPASLRAFFGEWWGLLIVVCPAISMRLLSEEIRTGTIEPLLTSPRAEFGIVAGKFAAALAFFATALAPTLLFVATLMALARPEVGPMFSGYLGMLLLGSLYLAVGTFVSSLTASQTLAFLATLFSIMLVEFGSQRLAAIAPQPLDRFVSALSASARIGDFAKGIVDTSHVAFFVCASLLFVSLAAITLRVRRWR